MLQMWSRFLGKGYSSETSYVLGHVQLAVQHADKIYLIVDNQGGLCYQRSLEEELDIVGDDEVE